MENHTMQLNEKPALTSAEDNPTFYNCFGSYSHDDSNCEGGVDAQGRKIDPCRCRVSCANIEAIHHVQTVIKPETLTVRKSPSTTSTSISTSTSAPAFNSRPIQSSTPSKEAAPALITPRPTPTGRGPEPTASSISIRKVVDSEGVFHQPHVKGRYGILAGKESRAHSKKKRLMAETVRAGLSAAIAAMGQQISAFISAVPFLDGGDESDYLRNPIPKALVGAEKCAVRGCSKVHKAWTHNPRFRRGCGFAHVGRSR